MDNKLIIYDSNCKVCSGLREMFLKFTPVGADRIVAYSDLDDAMLKKINPAKFKNVMALIDPGPDKNTIYGAEAVSFIFSHYYKICRWLLKYRLVFRMFEIAYKILSNNRYIIATPRSKFECDCYPDKVYKYRWAYFIICLFLAIGLTALIGVSFSGFFNISPVTGALEMLLIAGTGWVFQITLTAFLLKDKWLEYIGHLGTIMVAGLLVSFPWILFNLITGIEFALFPALSILISSALMTMLHISRVSYLRLPRFLNVTWFLFLQTTAAYWICYFQLF
jgi:predicted DCC family thiol-disulfide oxidoreductase YuxK